MVTRGFAGRQLTSDRSGRIPPGQHLVENFPVLTAGPAPRVAVEDCIVFGARPRRESSHQAAETGGRSPEQVSQHSFE